MLKIFIRHKWDGKKQVLKDLFRQRKIAIHYENIRSIDPDDYKKEAAKRALKLLKKCCKEGAFVGAAYREHNPSSLLVGKIRRGSKIKAEPYDDGKMILKVVKLSSASAKETSSMVLLANQPRQCTICNWRSAEKQLENIVKGKKIAFDIYSLHPSQLEVICYEYLRKKGILKALLLPIGGTLPDVDIYGIDSKGNDVLAQVTFDLKNKDKIQRLQKYSHKDALLYFFGPKKQEPFARIERIGKYIPIEKVFADLKKSPAHRRMINKMLFR